jgi:hypothetical protein
MTLSSPNDAKFARLDTFDTFALPGECIESGESGWRMSVECIESGESGWRMSGECIESGESSWRMSGECIESGHNGENGHFGEYSNLPNWRIFGEYSNLTNSPASGHCLRFLHSPKMFEWESVKNQVS